MTIGIDGRLWNESGVGRYIRNLVHGIDGQNTEDEFVIFLTKETFNKIEFRNPKIKKVVSDAHWHTLSEQWKFKGEIERANVDLMHFTYFSYPVFYKRPFVITIHDLILDHFPTGVASSRPKPIFKLKHFGYKKITSQAIKNAKKIIVPSNATKDEITKHYNATTEKIEVIYEGFDQSITKGKGTNLISNNYILYVGNAYPHKNLQILLEAFSKIRKDQKIDLVCIGRNDFFYKRIKNNQPGVHFLHDIDDYSLFDYYKGARLFVMPSLMEGFGLPVLEAMSLSCPVVCSNTPALKEICQNAAVYFDPKDPNDLKEKIEKVLSDKELLESLAQKGKKQSEKFSWEECVSETLKVYESCNSV